MVQFTNQISTYKMINNNRYSNIEYLSQNHIPDLNEIYDEEIVKLDEIFSDIINEIRTKRQQNIITHNLDLKITLFSSDLRE